MADAADCTCHLCGRSFFAKNKLRYHVEHGVCQKPDMTCTKCGKTFTRRTRFNEHLVKCCPEAAPSATFTNVTSSNCPSASVVINGDNHAPISNTSINNTTINNITINGFSETDIKLVIEMLMKNPGSLQIASQMQCMHQHLTNLTHFAGPPENRNVLKLDMKTSIMKVRDDEGKVLNITRKMGVDNIHLRNIRIADSDELRQYAQDPKNAMFPDEPRRNKIYGESTKEIGDRDNDVHILEMFDRVGPAQVNEIGAIYDALVKEGTISVVGKFELPRYFMRK